MHETVTTHSASETQQLAASIAARLAAAHHERAAVAILRGDLGAGKTTFTQGLLRALGVTESVTSPTFVLVHRYPLAAGRFANVYHLDAYRLSSREDLEALELAEPLQDPRNVFVVEWPEVGGDFLTPTVDILFAHGENPEVRTVTLSWQQ